MSKWPDPTPGICDNCGASLYGEYCHQCGQHERSYLRNVFSLISEVLEEFGSWDSRVLRTLVPLLFRPAFLSNEYVVGRRVRYVPPIRLYLFVSLIFFLVLTFVARIDTGDLVVDRSPTVTTEQSAESPVEPLPPCPDDVDGVEFRQGNGRPWSERLCVNVPWLTEESNQRLHRQIVRVAETPDLAFQQARQLAPVMMFFLLPVFAVVLKMLYLFSRRYYTEHLTLALHTHSFLFLAFLLMMGFSGVGNWAQAAGHAWIETAIGFLGAILMMWMPVYLWLAQKRFYGQGVFMTTFKFSLTGFVYMLMVSFTAMALVLVSVLSA